MEKIIEAWNNGAVIECRNKRSYHKEWFRLHTIDECPKVNWHNDLYEYRIAE